MRGIRSAEVVLPCQELEESLVFFTDVLGFRIRCVSPADDPVAVVIEGHGLVLRLDREASGDPGVIRLTCESGEAKILTAPNGTRIEIAADGPLHVPPLKPSLVLSRLADAEWSHGRAGMGYRDLIPGRQGGRFIASHIRVSEGGAVPDYVHFHRIHFQLIVCHRGWVRVVYEDQGEPIVLEPGDCVLQPPGIRHRVLECSAGLEVVEVACPARHDTFADHQLVLPTAAQPTREFDGQRFVFDRAAGARWETAAPGFQIRDMGISDGTGGLAGAEIWRPDGSLGPESLSHAGELCMNFVLEGATTIDCPGLGAHSLGAGDSIVIPPRTAYTFARRSDDLRLLRVTAPA